MRLTTCEGCGKPYRKTRRTRHNRCSDCRPAPSTNPRNDPEYVRNREIVLAGDPLCFWCNLAPATTSDHAKPLSEGGDNSLENMVPACGPCNSRRGGRQGRRRSSSARPMDRMAR